MCVCVCVCVCCVHVCVCVCVCVCYVGWSPHLALLLIEITRHRNAFFLPIGILIFEFSGASPFLIYKTFPMIPVLTHYITRNIFEVMKNTTYFVIISLFFSKYLKLIKMDKSVFEFKLFIIIYIYIYIYIFGVIALVFIKIMEELYAWEYLLSSWK